MDLIRSFLPEPPEGGRGSVRKDRTWSTGENCGQKDRLLAKERVTYGEDTLVNPV